jgi:hypothetical protein
MIFNYCLQRWKLNLPNLIANWPAPSNIQALTTVRIGGYSEAPYNQNNLGLHVGDNETQVKANRAQLVNALNLACEPVWLEQTHSTDCVIVEEDANRRADAAITRSIKFPLAIMTADCLPIMFCNRSGTEIAAVHAGWRGLAFGIVENTIAKMQSPPETLMAWIGPAICPTCYKIGDEVHQTFSNRYPFTKNTFTTNGSQRYADLPKMAELILKSQGVAAVYQSGACTFELENDFYSYRREPQTGRMATLIWFKNT